MQCPCCECQLTLVYQSVLEKAANWTLPVETCTCSSIQQSLSTDWQWEKKKGKLYALNLFYTNYDLTEITVSCAYKQTWQTPQGRHTKCSAALGPQMLHAAPAPISAAARELSRSLEGRGSAKTQRPLVYLPIFLPRSLPSYKHFWWLETITPPTLLLPPTIYYTNAAPVHPPHS